MGNACSEYIEKQEIKVDISQYSKKIKGSAPKRRMENQNLHIINIKGVPVQGYKFLKAQKKTKTNEFSNENITFTDDKYLKQVEEEVEDFRSRVTDTYQFPNSIHCLLQTQFGTNDIWGSGVIIGPYHVLTAAHNVWDNDNNIEGSSIYVTPGLNGTQSTFGKIKVFHYELLDGWVDGDKNMDLAILYLEKDIGNSTGWAGLASLSDSEFHSQQFYVTGYPGDQECGELWEMEGDIIPKSKDLVNYKIFTYNGQSGSAIWAKSESNPIVVGIHVRGSRGLNEGIRINDKNLAWIRECLEDVEIIENRKLAQALCEQGSQNETTLKRITDYFLIADIYKNQGDEDKSLSFINQAIKADPNFIRAYIIKGQLCYSMEQVKAAIIAYQQALKIEPKNLSIFKLLGHVYESEQMNSEALELYNEIITEIDANNIFALNAIGNIFEQQGNYLWALGSYSKVLSIEPNNSCALNGKGVILEKQGNIYEANHTYQMALEADPKNQLARFNLQNLSERLGPYKMNINHTNSGMGYPHFHPYSNRSSNQIPGLGIY